MLRHQRAISIQQMRENRQVGGQRLLDAPHRQQARRRVRQPLTAQKRQPLVKRDRRRGCRRRRGQFPHGKRGMIGAAIEGLRHARQREQVRQWWRVLRREELCRHFRRKHQCPPTLHPARRRIAPQVAPQRVRVNGVHAIIRHNQCRRRSGGPVTRHLVEDGLILLACFDRHRPASKAIRQGAPAVDEQEDAGYCRYCVLDCFCWCLFLTTRKKFLKDKCRQRVNHRQRPDQPYRTGRVRRDRAGDQRQPQPQQHQTIKWSPPAPQRQPQAAHEKQRRQRVKQRAIGQRICPARVAGEGENAQRGPRRRPYRSPIPLAQSRQWPR